MSEKKINNTVDLLNDDPFDSIVALTLPTIGSSIIQQLYSITDTFWISNQGYNALAAVGTAGSFLNFNLALMVVIRTGAQILVGQAYGRKDYKGVYNLATIAMQYSAIASLLILILQLFLAPFEINFVGLNNPETVSLGISYLRISAIGLPFVFATGILTSILAALGNTKIAFKSSALGLFINMGLDPIFINVFNLSAKGAAIATVISQVTVLVLIVIGINRAEILANFLTLDNLPSFFKFYKGKAYLEILRLGIPAGLQTMLFSGAAILISRIVANFGDIEVSAQKIGAQFENLAWAVAQAFGTSLTAFTAQNLAAKQDKRLKRGYRSGLVLSFIIGALATILMVIFPEQVLQFFFSTEREIAAGARYMRIVGFSQIFQCIELMTSGAFAGQGKTLYPAIVVSALTVLRVPVASKLSQTSLGITGVWLAISVSTILKGLVLGISYEINLKRVEARDDDV